MTVNEYNKCVDLYSNSIYRFILKNIKDEELARDIIQETFLKMWEKVKDVSFEKAKTYLFTIAYHEMINTIRYYERTPMAEDPVMKDHIVYQKNFDVQQVLNQAAELLPPDQKTVLLLRDYEGYSYQEIETITGLKESQVKVYIYRARLFLKQYIGKLENVI